MSDSRATDNREIYLTLDLALRVGELLMSSGAGAADVTATMLSITHGAGLRNCEVDVTFTSLSLAYQSAPGEPTHSQMRQVTHRTLDYSHLTDVDHLVRAYLEGEIDQEEARSTLATIVSGRRRYPRWAISGGWGVMGVGASLLTGGDWIVMIIAFVGAVTVDLLMRSMTRRRYPPFYQQVAGGLVATLLAVGLSATPVPVDSSAVITSFIILLLAGIAFTGAVQDALTGFYVTASARSMEVMLLTGGIIAGVSGGLAVADYFGVSLSFDPNVGGWNDSGTLLLGAALTSAASAFATYTPLRAIAPIAVVGVVGELIYRAMFLEGFGRPFSSAVAAIGIGVMSYSVAGRFRVPPLVVIVPGFVSLLPGFSTYTGLYQISEGDVTGLVSFGTAAAVAVALASGVILGEFVAQPLKREARRLELRLAGPRLVGPFRARGSRRAGQ